MRAFRDLIERTSWPTWRKDEFIRAVEALAEAQLVTEAVIAMPGDAGFRERFAAAFILFAKC
ncbi:hypothetical protein [Bradyrhizobium sp. YR681]|uniref:hypothetical protein n=1 Tax=Bradyrhizobium sp. YR681 TaxID=1144344 RepID=UPI0002DCD60A|nr:hypothetical protein [Bradyrhizobium sp. YR681]